MLEKGIQRHAAGDISGAAAIYKEVLAQDPKNAQALNLLGVVALQNEDYPEAIRLIRESIAIDDKNPGYFNNLGQALYAAGDVVEAEESYRRALKGNPQDANFLNNLGIALGDLDRLKEAKAAYEQALKHQSDDPEIFHNYGVLLQGMGHQAEAGEALQQALRLNPHMEATHLSLGAVFNEMGDKEAAIGAYGSAIELNPLYVDAHEALKLIYWDLGDKGRMDDSYFHACQILPQSSEAHSNLGRALVFSQRLEEAEKALNRALELDPQNPEAHSQLGRVFARYGKFDHAAAEHQEAIRLDGANALYHEELGDTLAKAGDFKQAADVLLKGHALDPRRSSILGALTTAMNETGDPRVLGFVDHEEFVTTCLIEVPDGFDDLDDFNDALHDELEKKHLDRPEPPGQTMRGGTQIPDNLFSNPSDLTAVVKEKISKAVTEYLGGLEQDPDHPFLRYLNMRFRFTGAWSTILHGSGYDGSHLHNEGWISGVYYVKVPDLSEDRWEAGEGCIQLGEPPENFVSERNQAKRLIRPEPGMTVLFPSYYWHGVRPFEEKGLRHSIAFDII